MADPPDPRGVALRQNSDPLDWTIEQVVDELRTKLDLPEATLEMFKDNEIDGHVLVTAIGLDELKTEVGVKAFGQRVRIMEVIKECRHRSLRYKEQQRQDESEPEMSFFRIRPLEMDRPREKEPLRLLDSSGPLVLTRPLSANAEYISFNPGTVLNQLQEEATDDADENEEDHPAASQGNFSVDDASQMEVANDLEVNDTPAASQRSAPHDPIEDELHREFMMATTMRRSRSLSSSHSPPAFPDRTPSPSPTLDLPQSPLFSPPHVSQTETPPPSDNPTSPVAETERGDEHPPKRRRVQPEFVAPVRSASSPVSEPEAQTQQSQPEVLDPAHDSQGRKRIAPTFLRPPRGESESGSEGEVEQHHDHADDVEMVDAGGAVPEPATFIRAWRSRRAPRRKAYLDWRSRSINSIIYSTTIPGQDMEEVDAKKDSFYAVANNAAPGTKRYVARQIRRLLRNTAELKDYGFASRPDLVVKGITKSGKFRTVYRPFDKAESLDRRDPDLVMVIDLDPLDNTLSASLVDDSEFEFPWGTPSKPSQVLREEPKRRNLLMAIGGNGGIDDFEYLAIKYQQKPDDEVFGPLGESGDEGIYDSEVYKSMEEEVQARAHRNLDKGEVLHAIEEGIRRLKENWKISQLPKEERKAHRIWNEHARNKTRKAERKRARDEIERIKSKVQDQKAAILDQDDWKSKARVIAQCKSMEEHIWRTEYLNWLITLLDKTTAPSPPLRAPRQPKRPKLLPLEELHDPNASEEDIPSHSEDEGEDYDDSDSDGMDDFVVPDDPEELARAAQLQGSDVDMGDVSSDSEIEMLQPKAGPKAKPKPRPSQPSSLETPPSLKAPSGANKRRRDSRTVSPDPAIKQRSSPITSPITPANKSTKSSSKSVVDLTLDSDSDAPVPISSRRVSEKARLFPNAALKKDSLAPSKPPPRTPAPAFNLPPSSQSRIGTPSQLRTHIQKKNADGLLEYFVKELGNKQLELMQKKLTADFLPLKTRIFEYYSSIREDRKGKKKAPGPEDRARLDNSDRLIANIYAKVKLCLAKDPDELLHETVNLLHREAEFRAFLRALANQVENEIDDRENGGEYRPGGHVSEVESIHDFTTPPPNPGRINLGSSPAVNSSPSGALARKHKKKSHTSKTLQRARDKQNTPAPRWDDDDEIVEDTPSRRRAQREIIEDADARKAREALKKQEELARRRAKDNFKKDIVNVGGKVIANAGRYRTHSEIFVTDAIARHLKEHQIGGIQFLWGQLTLSNVQKIEDIHRDTGALLSHTMGLGKTLQVITFLDTLTRAGNSADPKILKQVPDRLKGIPHSLILCPPSLVDNWEGEFIRWLPEDEYRKPDTRYLGRIVKVTSDFPPKDRYRILTEWDENGGVLIMGYWLFRLLLSRIAKSVPEEDEVLKEAVPAKIGRFTPEQFDNIERILLRRPDIVVADEAHEMKNIKSRLNLLMKKIETRSRIAMTGSPLSNHLREYFSLIDWIHPGYLGNWQEFDQKYVVPITNGLYVDSTAGERRESQKMLQVLNTDVEPKVHRKDINAIKDSMPPKKEFLISVPLSPLQEKLYNLFLETTRIAREQGTDTYSLFDFVSTLQYMCNHPHIFMQYVRSRNSGADARLKQMVYKALPMDGGAEGTGGDAADVEEPQLLDPEKIAPGIAEQSEQAIVGFGDLAAEEHSYRIVCLRRIVEATLSQDKTGKILIFTHWIKTLDYLANVLTNWGYGFIRLEGKVPTSARQKQCEELNSAASTKRIMIISVKAGGLGLNLQGANRVVIFDCGWTPTVEEQAVGRAYRLGQTRPVYVYRFMAGGTFEAKRRNKTEFKLQLATKVVDKKDRIRHSQRSNKRYAAPPEPVEQQDLTEFRGKDKVLDALLNSEEGKFVRQIEETDTFVTEASELTAEDELEVQTILQANEHNRKLGLPISSDFPSSTQTPRPPLIPPGSQAPRPGLGYPRPPAGDFSLGGPSSTPLPAGSQAAPSGTPTTIKKKKQIPRTPTEPQEPTMPMLPPGERFAGPEHLRGMTGGGSDVDFLVID